MYVQCMYVLVTLRMLGDQAGEHTGPSDLAGLEQLPVELSVNICAPHAMSHYTGKHVPKPHVRSCYSHCEV